MARLVSRQDLDVEVDFYGWCLQDVDDSMVPVTFPEGFEGGAFLTALEGRLDFAGAGHTHTAALAAEVWDGAPAAAGRGDGWDEVAESRIFCCSGELAVWAVAGGPMPAYVQLSDQSAGWRVRAHCRGREAVRQLAPRGRPRGRGALPGPVLARRHVRKKRRGGAVRLLPPSFLSKSRADLDEEAVLRPRGLARRDRRTAEQPDPRRGEDCPTRRADRPETGGCRAGNSHLPGDRCSHYCGRRTAGAFVTWTVVASGDGQRTPAPIEITRKRPDRAGGNACTRLRSLLRLGVSPVTAVG